MSVPPLGMRTCDRNAAAVPWALAADVKRFGTAGFADAPEALWHPLQSVEKVGGSDGAVLPAGMHAGGSAIPGEPLAPVVPEEPAPPLFAFPAPAFPEPELTEAELLEPELPPLELPKPELVAPWPGTFPPPEHPATNRKIAKSALLFQRARQSLDMGWSNPSAFMV